ncbi:MAG TPA: hypothetical protein VHN79_06350 [Lacunisphaera sp.]|nr:hypothetical protein [Lacunisphaera sp.]
MKKTLTALLVACGLAGSAHALVLGADIGYLLDSKEAYYTGRFGWELKANETYRHQLEVEVGYTETREAGGRADLVPLTFNYRLAGVTSGNFGYYVGAGAGIGRLSVDGVSTGGSVRLRDTSFAAQGFAGLTYEASPAVIVSVGAKYIWIDDVTLASTTFEVGDDVALSAGISIKF